MNQLTDKQAQALYTKGYIDLMRAVIHQWKIDRKPKKCYEAISLWEEILIEYNKSTPCYPAQGSLQIEQAV